MRAAAELAREAVDLDHAHDVAVLLAEEHHRAELARLVDRRLERRAPGWFSKTCSLTSSLDLASRSSGVSACSCVKSKRSLSGRTAEPAWCDVLAEHLAERLVQEVRRGVVRHRREAHRPRDDGLHAVAGGEALALEDEHLVVADADRLAQLRAGAGLVVLDPAGVA